MKVRMLLVALTCLWLGPALGETEQAPVPVLAAVQGEWQGALTYRSKTVYSYDRLTFDFDAGRLTWSSVVRKKK